MLQMSSRSNKAINNSPKERTYLGEKDEIKQVDLIEIQKKSWQRFLDNDLAQILHEFFPIDDYTKKNFTLELNDIVYGEPRHDLKQCLEKKLTYHFPVYIKVTLISKKNNSKKSQDVYFCNLPKMTDRGTFIINGIERAVISQIARSPGIYFTAEVDKTTGATVYNAEIRPYIGSWLDFTIAKNNLIEAKINKRRKFLATSFLRAMKDLSDNDIINLFSGLEPGMAEKFLVPTLEKDQVKSRDGAILEIYKKIRPGEPLVIDTARETIENLFFNPRRYTMANVGRYKINRKFGLNIPIEKENYILALEDIVASITYLINLTVGKGQFDDIDHLSNRRIRTVGELVGMYGIRVGMVRTERDIKARMSMTATDADVLPSQVINSKSLIATVNSFFRTSQLSTIVDQTNPLSEIDNLRRLTVGGPCVIEKERDSFSIRDISSSQYGRICPIRSPEGPNIGVVTYLALYSKINKYGFIETPYKKVIKEGPGKNVKTKIGEEIVYLQSDDEEE